MGRGEGGHRTRGGRTWDEGRKDIGRGGGGHRMRRSILAYAGEVDMRTLYANFLYVPQYKNTHSPFPV